MNTSTFLDTPMNIPDITHTDEDEGINNDNHHCFASRTNASTPQVSANTMLRSSSNSLSSSRSLSSLSTENSDNSLMSRIIAASTGGALNGDDYEPECINVRSIVNTTVKNMVWNKYKFLTDAGISCMEIQGSNARNNILGMLLIATNKESATLVRKISFWKRYGKYVQSCLAERRASATTTVGREIKKG